MPLGILRTGSTRLYSQRLLHRLLYLLPGWELKNGLRPLVGSLLVDDMTSTGGGSRLTRMISLGIT